MTSLAYDIALARLAAAGVRWLDQRLHGVDTDPEISDRLRAFRRIERRDRKRARKSRNA